MAKPPVKRKTLSAASPPKAKAEARLAAALRANLRRRKSPAVQAGPDLARKR